MDTPGGEGKMTVQANAQKMTPNKEHGNTKRQADIYRSKTSGSRCAEDGVESTLSQDFDAAGVGRFAFHTRLPALNRLSHSVWLYIGTEPSGCNDRDFGLYAGPKTGYITPNHCRDFQVVGAARAPPAPPHPLICHLPLRSVLA